MRLFQTKTHYISQIFNVNIQVYHLDNIKACYFSSPDQSNQNPIHRSNMVNPIFSLYWVWAIFFFASESDGFRDRGAVLGHHSPPAIFVFGDSLSDTGNLMAAFPFLADAENSPYGSTFFHGPSGRYSDGRLIIDFMASKWGFPFVEPYFENIVPNYRRGINFAVSGATARNVTEPIPFFLPLQTDQFVRFKRSVNASLNSEHKSDCLVSHVPEVKSFEDGLYMIFIGVNDILNSLFLNASAPPFVMEEIVPRVISSIFKAVQDLYKEGAKNFIVFNIPAIGCTPMVLTLGSSGPFNSTDGLGCLKDYNQVARYSNNELEKALAILTHQIEHINIMVADIYGFMLKTIANPARYGFDDRAKFKACCGFGGDPFNYNPLVPCGGNPAAKACSQPSKYTSWDGLHFTDAFNHRFVEEMMKSTPFPKFY
ncbi:GDSL esterase/lipase At1g09390-like [Magnolia sinica]|uniref:GDSL esterase/lipase At1g09390-like n=1 Tax=Magnolia sinica TaxID=86752 RepID=UPI00265874C3|nr:GDSL esterase/lipase At1g09390-like [Magnolia sinica]